MTRVDVRALQAPLKTQYREAPESATIAMRVRSGPSDLDDPLHCAVVPDSAPGVVFDGLVRIRRDHPAG